MEITVETIDAKALHDFHDSHYNLNYLSQKSAFIVKGFAFLYIDRPY